MRPWLLIAALLLASPAHAGNYTLDQIVAAAHRGLPESTLLSMVDPNSDEWDTIDAEQCVQLLRAGLPAVVLTHMTKGRLPTEAELAAAKEDGTAYSSTIKVEPRAAYPSDEGVVFGPEYADGHAFWTYTSPTMIVSAFVLDDTPFTAVFLSVTNIGTDKLNVFPRDVQLSLQQSGQRVGLEAFSPSLYTRKLENRQLWTNLLVTITAPGYLTSLQQGATVSDQIRGQENAYIVGQRYLAESSQMIAEATDLLLRSNTLYPGQTVAGIIPFKYRPSPEDTFRVYIRVNGETVTMPGRIRQ